MDELDSIQFGVASAEYILKYLSVVEINSVDKHSDNSVYDERMGPVNNKLCKVCGYNTLKCTGHFGHINLVEHVANPLFSQRLLNYFGIFCWNCSKRILKVLPSQRSGRNESFLSIINSKSKNVACHSCSAKNPIFSIEKNGILMIDGARMDTLKAYNMLKDIDINDLKEININATYSHPKDYLIKVLPVLPHVNRPFMVQGTQICDDDLTTLYLDIIKHNNKAKDAKNQTEYHDHINKIAASIQTLFNNSGGNAKHPASGRQVKGIIERFTSKDGIIRYHLTSKRVDNTARAVLSPGPELPMDHVGLPRYIANILTCPVKCIEDNIDKLQQLCDESKISKVERLTNGEWLEFGVAKFCNQPQTKLEPGDVISRDGLPIVVLTGREVLQNGDKIWRGGVLIDATPAFKKRFEIKLGDVIFRYLEDGDLVLVNRQPTLHTGSLAAMTIKIEDDFTIKLPLSLVSQLNGDFDGDEGNIHALQTTEALQELHDKAHVSNRLISPSNGKPMVTMVQDTVMSLYLMTSNIEIVDDDLIDMDEMIRINNIRKKLKIEKRMHDSLALMSSCLPHKFTVDHTAEHLNEKFQIVCGVWVYGVCTKQVCQKIIGLVYKKLGKEVTCTMINNWQRIAVKWITRRGFSINADDVTPLDYSHVFSKTIDGLEQGLDSRQIRDSIHTQVMVNQDNNLLKCIKSGAKGTLINLGQAIGTIGQQYSKSNIITPSLSDGRVIAQDMFSNSQLDDLVKHGYIIHSYAHGLDPRELLIHAIPARESVVSTAVKTAITGYLTHRTAMILNDAGLNEDGHVIFKSGLPKTLALIYNNNKNIFDLI